ncbi:MAG: hypothetical protein ABFC34_06690 [Methanobacterium sp.]
MKTCLNQQELSLLLNHKIHKRPIDNDLEFRCNLAEQWSQPIGVLTYLLARVLEENNIADKREECVNYLETLYDLSEIMYIEVQEIDFAFISILLKTIRQPDLTIEEELVELHTTMMNHDYTRIIRY